MKLFFTLIIAFLFISFNNYAQTTFWYKNGGQETWNIKTDIFAFRCLAGALYTGYLDPAIVDSLKYHDSRNDKSNEIFFNPTSTIADRLTVVQAITSDPQFEIPFITITKDSTYTNAQEKYYVVDDLLLINFFIPNPTTSFISNFAATNDLILISSPSLTLPQNSSMPFSYSYTFKINWNAINLASPDYFIEKARNIYSNNIGIVKNTTPNIVNIRNYKDNVGNTPIINPDLDPYLPLSDCPTNDPLFGELTNIANNGYVETNSGASPGTIGADANICPCWDQGLTGANVKVAVAGAGSYYFNHQDLSSIDMSLGKWDCFSGTCTNSLVNNINGGDFGQRITGVIAATKNNGLSTSGIAPNVKIIPLRIGLQFTSYIAIDAALQKAGDLDADIFVTHFAADVPNANFENDIFLLNRDGRAGKGLIVIAPTGDLDWSSTANLGTTNNIYPACHNYLDDGIPEVIGVIGSNRNDKKSDWEMANYQYQTAVNFGSQYEVGAPGPRIAVPSRTGPFGDETLSSAESSCNAVGTTAGIVALLLEDNPNLNFLQVRNKLIYGADKVGGYNYINGKSNELSFGRINCGVSLAIDANTGFQDYKLPNDGIELSYESGFWKLEFERENIKVNVQILSIDGNILFDLQSNTTKVIKIPNTQFINGMYILRVFNKNTNNSTFFKLIK
jgi:hypothetical protein